MTKITIPSITLQPVSEGLPDVETDPYYGNEYSIECMVVVDGKEVFDRSAKYCFRHEGWVWGDMALGHLPNDYIEELGGDEPKVTHWAPWPTIPALVAAA